MELANRHRPCAFRHNAAITYRVDESSMERRAAPLVRLPQGAVQRSAREDKRQSTAVSFSAGGSDPRAMNADCPARMVARPAVMHRGCLAAPPGGKQSKGEHLLSLQALGVNVSSDLELLSSRKSPPVSPEQGHRRTRMEELQGMPVAGWGADIKLVTGRRMNQESLDRCRGSSPHGARGCRASSPHEDKRELDNLSIEHQFARRHFSAPPQRPSSPWDQHPSDSSSGPWKHDFRHSVQAEAYAGLIGRPEGKGRRARRSASPPRRLEDRPAFYVDRGPKDVLFSSATGSTRGSRSENEGRDLNILVETVASRNRGGPVSARSMLEALRAATRNTPEAEVWDSMLNALPSMQDASSKDFQSTPRGDALQTKRVQAKVAAILAAAAEKSKEGRLPAKRVESPVKARMRSAPGDTPRRLLCPDMRDPMWSPSRNSVESVSTAAETEVESMCNATGRTQGLTSGSPSSQSPFSSPGDRNDHIQHQSLARTLSDNLDDGVAAWLREEQWKAKRRKAWH